jgi:hypothetical protein
LYGSSRVDHDAYSMYVMYSSSDGDHGAYAWSQVRATAQCQVHS